MRQVILSLLMFSVNLSFSQIPVLKNPGIPSAKHYTITDRLDSGEWVTTDIKISLVDEVGKKHYKVIINEGSYFLNDIDLNFDDLTSISERRTSIKDNSLVENYAYKGDNTVYYFYREKGIDKNFKVSDNNIYSRYAYFVSFQGFPFAVGKTVYFRTYMYEYGDAVNMKLSCIDTTKVDVKAGSFDCYKLELCVTGWLSAFAPRKFYLYFDKEAPHQFVKYEEKAEDGKWIANELIKVDC